MNKLDVGSFITGLFFTIVGVAFVLEGAGAWTFRLGHLRIVGPLIILLVGIAVLISSMAGAQRRAD
jgi:hypothetical protein